ncbi:MAG: hypothetical protein BroJett033_2620 [Chloroflexota bacterium]|nr:MAG: hypothetical protein BroJett033_2620 [Chloroflexota bacterium]
MQGSALIFFALLAAILLLTYVAIRREWFAPTGTAAASVIASVVAMTLVSLAQGNGVLQAVVVGIVVGALFSGVTLGIAWYFHSAELRRRYPDDVYPDDSYPGGAP